MTCADFDDVAVIATDGKGAAVTVDFTGGEDWPAPVVKQDEQFTLFGECVLGKRYRITGHQRFPQSRLLREKHAATNGWVQIDQVVESGKPVRSCSLAALETEALRESFDRFDARVSRAARGGPGA